jgi:hypothetical protein
VVSPVFFKEEGLLLRQRGRLVLQRDGGDVWILGRSIGSESGIGERVSVEGMRSETGILEVARIVISPDQAD